MEREKIFAHDLTNKGLISKIHKQLNIKKKKKKKKKNLKSVQKVCINSFPKNTYKLLRGMLIIREMQIKIKISSHLSEWLSPKRTQIVNQLYSNKN